MNRFCLGGEKESLPHTDLAGLKALYASKELQVASSQLVN
jgi:hypothetical protein